MRGIKKKKKRRLYSGSITSCRRGCRKVHACPGGHVCSRRTPAESTALRDASCQHGRVNVTVGLTRRTKRVTRRSTDASGGV